MERGACEGGERREMEGRVKEGEERRDEGRVSRVRRVDLSDIFYIPLYTFIYLDIPSNTPKYLCIPSYTLIYFKISNIGKMRLDVRPKNDHNSGLRASPSARIWHAPFYHIPRGFAMPEAAQI